MVGVIFVLSGAASYAQSKSPATNSQISQIKLVADASLLTERQLAIAQAIKEGRKTYSFSSNFTPGIGRVSDPAVYSQSWQAHIQQTIPALKGVVAIGNYLAQQKK